jgi:large subunit ribosomal protein L46
MSSHVPPVTSSNAIAPYIVKSGILLSRPPLVTKILTPFEKAFYFYQKRLNERLAMPFTRYFYFKKDTPADNDWKRKAVERNGSAARELGGYQPYGKLGWNDEVLVGDNISEPQVMVETLVKDAVMRVEGEEELETMEANVERPLERWTEADKMRDMKRLDRKLARTLYLLVKAENGKWTLPSGTLVGRENLHQVYDPLAFYDLI